MKDNSKEAAPASPAGSEESICPRCMGTGEYGATLGGARPCAICHGTGKITPDIANEPPVGSGASVFAEVVPGRKATNWVEAQPPAAVPSERPIGNRFVCQGPIVKKSNGEVLPVEEPLFLIRARDHLAISTLLSYRADAIADGCNDYLLGLLNETIIAFQKFATEFPEKMKQPGVTRGK